LATVGSGTGFRTAIAAAAPAAELAAGADRRERAPDQGPSRDEALHAQGSGGDAATASEALATATASGATAAEQIAEVGQASARTGRHGPGPASLGVSIGQTLATTGVEGQAAGLLAATSSTTRAWASRPRSQLHRGRHRQGASALSLADALAVS
jgi:hypothetical protein